MHASACSSRLALQPEDRREVLLLYRLFSLVEPPGCWFSLDIAEYPELDHKLARRASNSEQAFAPGERALILSAPPGPELDLEASESRFEGDRPR